MKTNKIKKSYFVSSKTNIWSGFYTITNVKTFLWTICKLPPNSNTIWCENKNCIQNLISCIFENKQNYIKNTHSKNIVTNTIKVILTE